MNPKQNFLAQHLKDGEAYAGIILGERDYHLILLPGEQQGTWDICRAWAFSINAALPTRREQSLLYANLKEEFEGTWYWSSESLAATTGYVWVQGFDNGYQYGYHKSYEYRARAVRRIYLDELL